MKRLIYTLNLILILLLIIGCSSSHTITFVYNDNDMENNIVVVNDKEEINFPSIPTRNGYSFNGWYYDEGLSEIFKKDQEITEDITLYAKWDCVYNISYNLNGGKCENLITQFKDCNNVILPTPTKEGYDFIGWFYNDIKIEQLENKDYELKAEYQIAYKEADMVNVDRVRTELTVYKDIVYKDVGGMKLKLDLYLPPLQEDEKCPVLFFYFGGGWLVGSKEDISYGKAITDYVLANNIAIVACDYRLATVCQYPGPVEDCLDAIRFVVKNKDIIGVDVNNMGSIGYSAGGYMALMTGFAQDYFIGDPSLANYSFKLKYVVDMFGPAYYEVEELNKISNYGKFMLLMFFGTLTFEDEKYASAFASSYVEYNNPSVYIVHGLCDTLVPCSQSQRLYDLLQENNIDSSILFVEGAEHSLATASGYEDTNPTLSWIYEDIGKFIVEQSNK